MLHYVHTSVADWNGQRQIKISFQRQQIRIACGPYNIHGWLNFGQQDIA